MFHRNQMKLELLPNALPETWTAVDITSLSPYEALKGIVFFLAWQVMFTIALIFLKDRLPKYLCRPLLSP